MNKEKVVEGFSALTRKIRDAVDAVKDVVVRHYKFREAFNQAAEAIQYEPEDSVVAVVGPTGSGKTALARYLKSEMEAHCRAVGLKAGQIPTVSLEVEPAETNRFQWRPFYMQWLAALKEPMLGQKSDLHRHLQYLRDNGVPLRAADPAQLPLGVLRQLLIGALNARGNIVSLVDESQHLAKVSASVLTQQMDLIKSISNQTKARLVLLGTGEMLELLDRSAQLSRRVVVVELQPYRASIPDLREFGSGIASLLEQGPVRSEINLKKNVVHIHRRSLGLFGIAANWIRRGWTRAMLHDEPLNIEHLNATAFTNRQLERIQTEIDTCDRFFSADRRRISTTAPPPSSSGKPKGSRRPGRRKLGRDKVGQQEEAA